MENYFRQVNKTQGRKILEEFDEEKLQDIEEKKSTQLNEQLSMNNAIRSAIEAGITPSEFEVRKMSKINKPEKIDLELERERLLAEKKSLENVNFDEDFGDETERAHALARVKEFVDEIKDKKIEEVIFLDKSARLLGYFFSKAWDASLIDQEKPNISFINIGMEKKPTNDHYIPATDTKTFNRISLDAKKQLLEIFGDKFENKKICVFDEKIGEGASLTFTCRLLKNAYPSSEICGDWFDDGYRPSTPWFKILTQNPDNGKNSYYEIDTSIFSNKLSGVVEPLDKSAILADSWRKNTGNNLAVDHAGEMKRRREQLKKLAFELLK